MVIPAVGVGGLILARWGGQEEAAPGGAGPGWTPNGMWEANLKVATRGAQVGPAPCTTKMQGGPAAKTVFLPAELPEFANNKRVPPG